MIKRMLLGFVATLGLLGCSTAPIVKHPINVVFIKLCKQAELAITIYSDGTIKKVESADDIKETMTLDLDAAWDVTIRPDYGCPDPVRLDE